jgi:uncharacterized membrane protein
MSADFTPPPADPNRNITHVLYALYAASLISGITIIVAIILNYVKRDDVAGTLYESHFRWQIRTFWYSLLWGVLGGLTFLLFIGIVIWIVAGVWFIYRIAKGWLHLSESKPMYP